MDEAYWGYDRGIWFATQPGLAALQFIFIGWGISTGLTFWAAMLKAVAVLAKPEEQGRFFGMLDGGRGLVEALLATIAVALFAFSVESLGEHVTQALDRVIWLYVSFMLLLAPTVYFVINDSRSIADPAKEDSHHTLLADLKALAAKQEIWLSAACILTGYQLFWATYSFSAYLQVNFGLSAVAVGSITVAKLWMRPIGGTIAGFVGDFYDREAVLGILLLSCSIMLFLLTCLPRGVGANTLIAVVLAIGLLTYGVRGIWWSTLESCDVDDRTKGLAIGTLSLLAYSPDFYQPYISGLLLEAFPGKAGYDIYYIGIAGFGVLGTLAAFRLRSVVRRKQQHSVPASAPV